MTSNNKRDNEEGEASVRDMGRASWSKETLLIFCDLCIQYAERSKRETRCNNFTKNAMEGA